MNKNNVIQVFYDGKVVGQLAMRGHSTSFEYDDDWIKTGFPISPFSLPLEKQVFTPTKPSTDYSVPLQIVYQMLGDSFY